MINSKCKRVLRNNTSGISIPKCGHSSTNFKPSEEKEANGKPHALASYLHRKSIRHDPNRRLDRFQEGPAYEEDRIPSRAGFVSRLHPSIIVDKKYMLYVSLLR
jgi:hypothetical protein